jgi:hypothetical protein
MRLASVGRFYCYLVPLGDQLELHSIALAVGQMLPQPNFVRLINAEHEPFSLVGAGAIHLFHEALSG